MSVEGEERIILVHEDCGGGPGARLTIEELRMLNGALNLVAHAWRRYADAPENAHQRQVALDEASKADDLNARLARLP